MECNRERRNRLQRERRRVNGNASAKMYEKTPAGFLMRLYRNMQSRINGVQKAKYHLYRGKSLLSREAFYAWGLASDEFHRLMADYHESGFARRLAPSVDRIDSSKGYSIDNMEWVTMSENSRRGAIGSRKVRDS